MKNILLLGANGFVGTHVALALKDEACHLTLVVRDPTKLHKNLHALTQKVGDLRDPSFVKTLFKGFDIVINAFAWTALYGKEKMSKEAYLFPTLALIDHAKASGVQRFINLSTSSAASKHEAKDANAKGVKKAFWPHLNSVITIEDHLREVATSEFEVINMRCGLINHFKL